MVYGKENEEHQVGLVLIYGCVMKYTNFNSGISIVKPIRCLCFSKIFILVKHSTCFGRSSRPSSGAQDSTYSNRHMSDRYGYLLLAGRRWNEFHLAPARSR
jgi:hypothetical protein